MPATSQQATSQQATTHLPADFHAELLRLGFSHTHYPAQTFEHGTGETGPIVDHQPAYDGYRQGLIEIYVDEAGGTHMELIVEPPWLDQEGLDQDELGDWVDEAQQLRRNF